MALATLSIDLVARLASLEEGLGKAAQISARHAADVEARWQRVGGTVQAAFGALAGAATVGALTALARNTLNAVDALNDVADATGSSVENISALEDVALRTGTSLETVQTALVKFNASLKEAKPGSAIEQTLNAIGLSSKELKALDPSEALKRTADALANFADDGSKARAVQELFGKSLKEVAPFLKDLSEAGKLNATVTTAQAAEAEKLNKQLAALEANSEQAKRALLAVLVPAINDTVDKFKAAREAFGGTFGALFRNTFTQGDFTNAVEGLQHYRDELVVAEAKATELQKTIAGGGDAAFYARSAKARVDANVEDIRKQVRFYELLTKTANDAAGAGRGAVNPNNVDRRSIGDIPDAKKASQDFEKLNEQILRKIALQQAEADGQAKMTDAQKFALDTMVSLRDRTADLTQAQRAALGVNLEALLQLDQAATKRAALAKLTEEAVKLDEAAARAGFAQAEATAQQVQSLIEATVEIGKTATELEALRQARIEDRAATLDSLAAAAALGGESPQIVEAYRAQAKALRDLGAAQQANAIARERDGNKQAALQVFGQSQQGQLDALAAQLGKVQAAFDAGDITAKQYVESLDVLDEAFGKITAQADKAAEHVSTFADQAKRNIESGLAGTFEKQLKGEFDSIGDMWRDLLIKMASQAAAAKLSESIFGTGKEGDKGWVGQLVQLFSSQQAAGGAWQGGVQFFASGGVFNSPTAFAHSGGLGVLGEAGPEAVMPLQRGADGKLGVASRGGGAVTINISQSVGQFVTPGELARVSQATQQAAMAALVDAQRRGRG